MLLFESLNLKLHVQRPCWSSVCNTWINRLRQRKVVGGPERRFRKSNGMIFKKEGKKNIGKIKVVGMERLKARWIVKEERTGMGWWKAAVSFCHFTENSIVRHWIIYLQSDHLFLWNKRTRPGLPGEYLCFQTEKMVKW